MTLTHDPHLEAFKSELGSYLKRLRLTWGGTQDAAAAGAGVSQGEISRIERGDVAPNLTTIGRLLNAYADGNPAVYSVYFQQTMALLHESVEQARDWTCPRDVTTEAEARERATEELHGGNIVEALPYIVMVKMHADGRPLHSANADLLFGVHMSDLGIYEMATRYLDSGLKTLTDASLTGDEAAPGRMLRHMLLANKADLQRKRGLLDESEALSRFVLGDDCDETIRLFVLSVLGRIETQRGRPEVAVDLLREAVDGHARWGDEARSMADWIRIFLAEALSLTPDGGDEARELLDEVIAHSGPERDGRDPENYAWANLILAAHFDDAGALAASKRAANHERLGEVIEIIGEIEESGGQELPLRVALFRWRAMRAVFWSLVWILIGLATWAGDAAAKGLVKIYGDGLRY